MCLVTPSVNVVQVNKPFTASRGGPSVERGQLLVLEVAQSATARINVADEQHKGEGNGEQICR